jgi:hypothetical protein
MALNRLREMQMPKAMIVSISDLVEIKGAAPPVVQIPLETIRTDLDSFSDIEAEELLRHGYFCTERAVGVPGKTPPAFLSGAGSAATRARKLINGAQRRSRLVNLRDWVTWLQIACLLTLLQIGWLVARKVEGPFRLAYSAYRAAVIQERRIFPWLQLPVASPVEVAYIGAPQNAGFTMRLDEREWDLTGLSKNKVTGEVTGESQMTRTMLLTRDSENRTEFVSQFQTSGKDFRVSCEVPDGCQVQHTLVQKDENINGQSLFKVYQYGVDVSNTSVRAPFVLRVVNQSTDGFVRKQNWSVAMSITDPVPTGAAISIVFPHALARVQVRKLSYPNHTQAQTDTEEGAIARKFDSLTWDISHPRGGWTYRIEWNW